MQRATRILLLLTFSVAVFGLADALHRSVSAEHDEDACITCLLLHAPFSAAGWGTLLTCFGVLIIVAGPLAWRIDDQHAPMTLACRGPPAVA